MKKRRQKMAPGVVRDAILDSLYAQPHGASISEIQASVQTRLGPTASSSIRSYLRLNTPTIFAKMDRGVYRIREGAQENLALLFDDRPKSTNTRRNDLREFNFGKAQLLQGDCFEWLKDARPNSIEAVVTDPPYSLLEYSEIEQRKLRAGRGGVWRIPPSFDGVARAPLPRFTILTRDDLQRLEHFFESWARILHPILVPGAHLIIASNPLLSYVVANALTQTGFERRGEIIRLTMTMRGGDRPKAAHVEFEGVSVMPRSMWEPWLVFRKPLEGRVQDNLRKWGTGGFRRPSSDQPFGDVIPSSPTRKSERALAPHPSLKPQAFMRTIVRAVLPLGTGTILDPFAGAGSTLAAAEAIGYSSLGLERDPEYFRVACESIPKLRALRAA